MRALKKSFDPKWLLGRGNILACTIALLLSLAACQLKDANTVAKINGEAINKAEFVTALKFESSKYDRKEYPERYEEIKKLVLDDLMKNHLLYSEVKKLGLSMPEAEIAERIAEIKSRYTETTFRKMLELKGINYEDWKEDKKREILIDKLIQQEVASKIDVTNKDIQKYYKLHKKEFSHGDEVHARQILVDDAKKAAEIWAKANADENFAALAQEFSIAPEGKRGGDLGWFERGIMPKAFDEACFPLQTGSISPVVKTEFGYHIFKVVERREAKTLPIKDVEAKIIARVKQEKMERAFNEWFEPLRKKADIEINEELIKKLGMEER